MGNFLDYFWKFWVTMPIGVSTFLIIWDFNWPYGEFPGGFLTVLGHKAHRRLGISEQKEIL
jgi:hypothetical protein